MGEKGIDGKDGKDGLNGKDGQDGFGFDDMTMEYDGERTFTWKWTKGDRVEARSFNVPFVLDRGVYAPSHGYTKGDGVTTGGSWWIAQKETSSKPGEGNSDWRLAVKRGRDGKDGEKGPKGDPGAPGSPGRDLTNMGPDGSKWGR